ncbi:hypothetical protein LX69_01991 [Breznakibacter xylanolyticus]|uniref:Uncharacterized protein n=1 Tax=Breznakibacter xylanolyticus TaxID=990 RepID=A0A2W7NS64_9BACT|nr:hypothetical protein LX69_01991 [Breznakibacter xylanolyticus]
MFFPSLSHEIGSLKNTADFQMLPHLSTKKRCKITHFQQHYTIHPLSFFAKNVKHCYFYDHSSQNITGEKKSAAPKKNEFFPGAALFYMRANHTRTPINITSSTCSKSPFQL